MALQGDLSSFALPDVLRLLAGTAKSGRLVVDGGRGSGEIWLRDGELVGGSVSSSPHASEAADLVFELLRFDGGSFIFDDSDQLVDAAEPSSVEDAIVAAESLADEWAQVEAVVPSTASWVALVPEVEGEVVVTSEQWKLLAAVGDGRTVFALGDTFGLTDLAASRWVKDLVEGGFVEVGTAPEGVVAEPAPAAPETFDEPEAVSANDSYARDLALLSAEDGPVVLESSDDALLPEPLPGEGTSFAGGLDTLGTVDGPSFDPSESDAGLGAPEPEAAADEDRSWSSYGSFGTPEADESVAASSWDDLPAPPSFGEPEPAPADDSDDTDPDLPAAHADGADEGGESDDRGSLLKFLSTVKP